MPQADDVLCTDLTTLSDPALHYPISSDVRSPPMDPFTELTRNFRKVPGTSEATSPSLAQPTRSPQAVYAREASHGVSVSRNHG